jgi:RNA polymerase sigma-70 factor (ECF subfamily)
MAVSLSLTGRRSPGETIVVSEDTDEALMSRAADGDAFAFDQLAARHMRRTLALAQRLVGNAADAEEIAQDAFLRLWRHAPRWNPDQARFSTWLYRITVNLAIDRRRQRQPWQPLDQALEIRDAAPDAVDRIAARQEAAQVEQALARLPDRQRAAVVLFHQEGLTTRDAAAALGLSDGAFGSLLARARRALKSLLGGSGT